jgi:hypothetical protein
MELLLKIEEIEAVDEVADFDPAQLPCQLLAQFWYQWLAERETA